MVEKNNADKQNRQSEADAVAEIDPVERAAAEIGVAEGLDDRRHRVCEDQPAEAAAANHRERIDDRRCIHHQLHSKRDHLLQIAITCGQRRNNNACAKAKACHEQKEQRGESDCCGRLHRRALHPVKDEEREEER